MRLLLSCCQSRDVGNISSYCVRQHWNARVPWPDSEVASTNSSSPCIWNRNNNHPATTLTLHWGRSLWPVSVKQSRWPNSPWMRRGALTWWRCIDELCSTEGGFKREADTRSMFKDFDALRSSNIKSSSFHHSLHRVPPSSWRVKFGMFHAHLLLT